MNQKLIFTIASIYGALGVGIGAFGAHGLKKILEAHNRIETFQTGVEYQFYHVFALFVVGILMQWYNHDTLKIAAWMFTIGIFIFSFSLYALSLTGINKLGAITPIGGVFFIVGWFYLAYSLYKA
ncbi:MAG: hypothetical protein RLZZ175_1743 [Bacteroidota bacterium]|jgi:uncharacterized membrane protein YgdD (TMEM256/DUF423 family)